MSTPTNTDAERSILGAILLDNHAYLETSQGIAVEDFSLDSHRRIYSRMVQLMESNRPVDMVTLIDELNIHKDLEKIGDVAYIASLVQGVPERSSIQHYIDIVRDKAQQRSLATLCTTILSRIDQQNEKALPIMAAMEESLAVIAGKPRNEALSLRQLLPMVLNDMARERERQSEYIGIPTGIRDLDEALGGIREGELVIAGAMPGRGKTSFGVQFGINAVRENFPTIDFSLEMKNWQVGRRIIAGYTPASAFGARDAKMLSEARWQQVIESASQLAQLPLYVDDSSSISLREMRSRIKLYKKKFGIQLVIVDYLRLVTASGSDTRERVSNVALGLAQIAKDEQVAILALSQLKRPDDINHIPDMTDLKESGDLEAAAHVVLLLYRPVDKDSGIFTGVDSIIVGKAREGPACTIPVTYDDERLIFKPRMANY